MIFSVAIIDQGVDSKHDRLKDAVITGMTILKTREGFERKNNIFDDDTGHGTSIAAIMHRMVPDIPLVAIKLQSYDEKITEDLLVKAIEYCLTAGNVRLINISMGVPTEYPSTALRDICIMAAENNVMIVAAAYKFPNTACYPAHFDSVYGVSTGLVSNRFEYGYRDEAINVLAKGTTQRVASLNNGYKISSGTSFATAHFTGISANIIKTTQTTDPILLREHIRAGAKQNVQELFYFRNDIKNIVSKKSSIEFNEDGRKIFNSRSNTQYASSIAIYPVSEKEMRTVLEFTECCDYKINCLIDYPVRLVSKNEQTSGGKGLNIIRDIDKIDLTLFDTLVCGYILDQLADANIYFSLKLINKCLDHNKHFICWDVDVYNLITKLISERGDSCSSQAYVTSITGEQYQFIKEYKNLPYLNTPVLCVLGTSNKQGKVTAQMRIRMLLETEGYRVAHIGTEPQTHLLGADFVFPCGYKCPIEPGEPEWSRLLRIVLRGIQRYKKPDIILTGTQGGVLPRTKTISNEFGHDLSSLHFLLGVQPDAICCAINPIDDPQLISETLQIVKSYCKSIPLFCFMTPWTRTFITDKGGQNGLTHRRMLNKEEMSVKMRYFEEKVGIPVIDIMDTGEDPFILRSIQDVFSSPVVM